MRLTNHQIELMSEATLKKTAEVGLKHAKENLPYLKKTIKDLKRTIEEPKPSIVISAGPSLIRNKSIEMIKKSNFKGNIIAVDCSMQQCLRKGVVPDFVVTVDPLYVNRMVRLFGDPQITERPTDEYFQRQDLDPVLNTNVIAHNQELIELVNRYGKQIKVIISSSTNPEVTQRCLNAGMELYWWNPLYDDYEKENSLSRKIYQLNRAPCMVTGGNVGTSAWVFSHAILQSPIVVLTGMDNGYPSGTSVVKTQYYQYLKDILPDDPGKGLIEVYNPFLKETWLTDLAYCWYNEIFLQMATQAPCKTYNCTEGGILFGEGVKFASLQDCLKELE